MKKIIVTPAGRERYLSILVEHLKLAHYRQEFDEWHLWINTANENDKLYMFNLSTKYEWIKYIEHPINPNAREYSNCTIHFFFPVDAVDPDAVYLRLDDDVVWLDNFAINNMFAFRINNPNYALVMGNIVNNAICNYIHQHIGVLSTREGVAGYDCLDEIGYHNVDFASQVHKNFFMLESANQLSEYKFKRWELLDYERFSINVISWFGSDFAKFGGKVGRDEEHWLTVELPLVLEKHNCINGGALFSHFAFFGQRQHLEENTLSLQMYQTLAENIRRIYDL